MILRTLTAALLSAALALSSTAAPAAADSRDRGRLIGTIVGIGALAVIANELAKDKKKDDRRDPPRPGWGGHDSRVLPAACAFDIRDRDGSRRTVLGKSCLERSFRDARRLPRDCAFEIRDRGDRRTVYGERCLERAGYRIARRRY